MTDRTAHDCLEDVQLLPEAVIRSGKDGEVKLFIVFDEVEKVSHADYCFQLLRSYYLVQEYPRKPVVMIYGGLGRGTYISRKEILGVLRDRLSRVIA